MELIIFRDDVIFYLLSTVASLSCSLCSVCNIIHPKDHFFGFKCISSVPSLISASVFLLHRLGWMR